MQILSIAFSKRLCTAVTDVFLSKWGNYLPNLGGMGWVEGLVHLDCNRGLRGERQSRRRTRLNSETDVIKGDEVEDPPFLQWGRWRTQTAAWGVGVGRLPEAQLCLID